MMLVKPRCCDPPGMQLPVGSGKGLLRGAALALWASPSTKVGEESCLPPPPPPAVSLQFNLSPLPYFSPLLQRVMHLFDQLLSRLSSVTSPSWASRMQMVRHYGWVSVHFSPKYFSRTNQPCQHSAPAPRFPRHLEKALQVPPRAAGSCLCKVPAQVWPGHHFLRGACCHPRFGRKISCSQAYSGQCISNHVPP